MSLFEETLEAMKKDPAYGEYMRHREKSPRDRETDRFISHLLDMAAMAQENDEISELFDRVWEHYETTKEAYDRAMRRERYAPSMMDIYLRLQNLFDLYTKLNLAYWRKHGDTVPADADLFRLLAKFTEADILLSYCGLV